MQEVKNWVLVHLNCSLIHWMSKKQTSADWLRHKLRMMGTPVEGPVCIHGDNQSVSANTTIPDSILKKKSQSIAHHFVREGVACDEWRTAHVNTHDNPTDLLTKPLPAGAKRTKFVMMLLHHIFESEIQRMQREVASTL